MTNTKNDNPTITKASKSSISTKEFSLLKEYYENLEASVDLLITSSKDYYRYYFRLLKKSFYDLQNAKPKF